MLVQPRKPISTLALLDPEIPGGILLADGTWGINLAAARLNFPQGLKVQIPAWSSKDLGDNVKLLLNGNTVDQKTVTDPVELKERTTLFVPPERLLSGSWELSYSVKRISQALEPGPVLKLFVKLELPGGQDIDPDYGHSELAMAFDPPEVVRDGVGPEHLVDGVQIIVAPKSGSGLPYINVALGDVIIVGWAGQTVSSAPVTQAQIDAPDSNPIKILIDGDRIKAAGDSDLDGLSVSYMIRDRVLNQSEDWCKAERIVVDTGNSRLDAPILDQADGLRVDLDVLGDEKPVLQVWAQSSSEFSKDDVIIMRLTGITAEEQSIDIKVLQSIEKNPPTKVDVLHSNASLRALGTRSAVYAFELERDGQIIQRSKSRSYDIIGEPTRLAAPVALDEINGAISPDLPEYRIRIPYDPLITAENAIELKWFGTRPDNTIYDPELDWFFPSEDEAADPDGFIITVNGAHGNPLEGGTLDLSYNLLSDEGNDVIGRRPSQHAALLNIGKPQFELVKPIVLGEKDGVLEPKKLPGGIGKLTAPRPVANPTETGDIVTYTWVGEVTGEKEDFKKLNALSKDKDVEFALDAAFVAAHIEPNRGKKVTARYRILRVATNTTSHSNPLEFVVGEAETLKPPKIKEAPNDTSLDPIAAKDALTAVIPAYLNMIGTQIIVTWAGTAGSGSQTVGPINVSTQGDLNIPLDNAVVAFNLGKAVTVTYIVTGNDTPSDPLVLSVLPIANEDTRLPSPIINGNTNTELDVNTLPVQPLTRIDAWPLIKEGQPIWLRYFVDDNPTPISVTYNGQSVPPEGVPGGMHPYTPVVELKKLANGARLRIEFKVGYGGDTDEAKAVTFPQRTYIVKAVEDVKPEITSVEGSPSEVVIENGDWTIETSVVLTGKGIKGRKVQVLDGAFIKGEPEVDATNGTWTLTIDGLDIAEHRFTVRADASAPPSDAWVITVRKVNTRIPIVTPSFIVFRPDGQRAYISNGSPGNVFVIETVSNTIIETINLGGKHSARMAITPDGARLFVCHLENYSITIINTETNSPITVLPVGASPYSVCISPDGTKAYVCNETGKSISTVNVQNLTVQTTSLGSVRPIDAKVSADNSRLYICPFQGNSLLIVNAVNLSEIASIALGYTVLISPRYVVRTSDDSKIFVGSTGDGIIYIIDPLQLKLVGTINVGGTVMRGLAITPDNSKIYAIKYADEEIAVIDTGSSKVTETIGIGKNPSGIAVSPTGKHWYCAINGENVVVVNNV
ncbi:beta-propeller fold lactonase family protein [Pseudomonas sp. NPDC087639]|uniref:beta-propeller fold lactonase family protein n=1 Tax=Pseudomonas sp. NPDC087639 TaxID=3364445 RepID=UPI003820A1AF